MATPLIPFTIAWLIGIWAASRIALPTVAFGFAVGAAIPGIILSWRAPKPRWVFILTLAATLGALRFNLAQPRFDQTSLVTYNDQQQPVIVEGIVVAEPDVRDEYTNLRVQADKLSITDQPTRTAKGLALIQAPPFSNFRYGDRVRAEGKLQTPTNFGEAGRWWRMAPQWRSRTTRRCWKRIGRRNPEQQITCQANVAICLERRV